VLKPVEALTKATCSSRQISQILMSCALLNRQVSNITFNRIGPQTSRNVGGDGLYFTVFQPADIATMSISGAPVSIAACAARRTTLYVRFR